MDIISNKETCRLRTSLVTRLWAGFQQPVVADVLPVELRMRTSLRNGKLAS